MCSPSQVPLPRSFNSECPCGWGCLVPCTNPKPLQSSFLSCYGTRDSPCLLALDGQGASHSLPTVSVVCPLILRGPQSPVSLTDQTYISQQAAQICKGLCTPPYCRGCEVTFSHECPWMGLSSKISFLSNSSVPPYNFHCLVCRSLRSLFL